MTYLRIVVEGPTEEEFVKRTLSKHLQTYGVEATARVVITSRHKNGNKSGGGSSWTHWQRDLRLYLKDKSPELRVTTLLDLYALPANMPDLEKHGSLQNTTQRCDQLERAMAQDIADNRFIPYIQRHEVESLVLAALPALERHLESSSRKGLSLLIKDVGHRPPEDVNDGKHSAPSKRLARSIPSYQKPLHGPLALADAGIATIRKQCPRFHAWVEALEQLGTVGKSAS